MKKLLVPLTAIQILENVTEFLARVCRNGRSLHLNHYFAPVLAETFLNRLLEQEVEGVAQRLVADSVAKRQAFLVGLVQVEIRLFIAHLRTLI